jgi:transcription elongation GreA/GreB family factor
MIMTTTLRPQPDHKAIPLSLRGRGAIWTPELEAFARRRLSYAFGRFAKRIRDIAIWLEDANGPRGGVDKQCRIEIRLTSKGHVVASSSTSSEYSAISRSVSRARAVLVRNLKQKTHTNKRARARAARQQTESESNEVSMHANSRLERDPNSLRLAAAERAVAIGSTVAIRDLQSGELEVYTLVRPDEADITHNRISSFTPAGSALYGRRVGETVEIVAPGGTIHVRIESVRDAADGDGEDDP